jgi:hypothetical protein
MDKSFAQHPFGHPARFATKATQQAGGRDLKQAALLDQFPQQGTLPKQLAVSFGVGQQARNACTLQLRQQSLHGDEAFVGQFQQHVLSMVAQCQHFTTLQSGRQIRLDANVGPRQHPQWNMMLAQVLRELPGSAAHQVAPNMAVAPQLVRRDDGQLHAFGDGDSGHLQCFVPGPRPIIGRGQEVAVNVRQGPAVRVLAG